MARSLGSQSHIVIVDTRPQDYHGLTTIASQCQWNIHFLTHGRAAIRFAQPDGVELWLINTQLPDISGFDLVSQLRTRCGGASIFVISDQYRVSEEARACSQGANLFLTKDNNHSLDCDQLVALLNQSAPIDFARPPTGARDWTEPIVDHESRNIHSSSDV